MNHGQAPHRDIPSSAFVNQVKRALEHLYDTVYLERHPLAFGDGSTGNPSATIAGQRLRWELSAAIESLNPGGRVPFSAPPARIYNLVSLRYVEGRTVLQAAQELNLSERQAHRELRQGEERVATILWARRSVLPRQETSAAHLSSFEAEMARFEIHPHPIDIRDLLRHAQEAVEVQAVQRNVRFYVEMPPDPLILSLDPVMAEQVLVNTLSYAIEQAHPGPFHLTLAAGEGKVVLTLCYFLKCGVVSTSALDLVILQLADRLGWVVQQAAPEGDLATTLSELPEGAQTIALHIPVHRLTVLVVDDNNGLVDLLERYLTDQACRVVGAANGREGLRLVQKLVPDAILLDVMMPEMHGWEFLQRLRAQPAMASIPVIICSVIHNPRLAYSLGASLFLPKPVRRRDVLEALHQVGVM